MRDGIATGTRGDVRPRSASRVRRCELHFDGLDDAWIRERSCAYDTELCVSEGFGGRLTVDAGGILSTRGARNVSVGRVDGEEDVSPIGTDVRPSGPGLRNGRRTLKTVHTRTTIALKTPLDYQKWQVSTGNSPEYSPYHRIGEFIGH